MKLVIAATGASGAPYLQRLLDYLKPMNSGSGQQHEIHLVLSPFAQQVIHHEIGKLHLSEDVLQYSNQTMNAPFASGSSQFDAMVIIPCSMGSVGRIATGISNSLITRAADVFLKERRKLILVARETPWNLLHAKNVTTLLEAGAIFLPAMPSFYSKPQSLEELVDTVVWRILDQLGLPAPNACRWQGNESPRSLRSHL